MDVKSTFLKRDLHEEVCTKQPDGFKLHGKEDNVWSLKNDLYGLKQAPRAWYELLDEYLFQQGFKRCIANRNIFLKTEKSGILVTVVCVDDIIFCCNDDKLSREFANLMALEFEMSIYGDEKCHLQKP